MEANIADHVTELGRDALKHCLGGGEGHVALLHAEHHFQSGILHSFHLKSETAKLQITHMGFVCIYTNVLSNY